MNIKIGDILVSKGVTTIREGKVFAIGEASVVVRVTKSGKGGVSVGDMYEIWGEWFEGGSAFYGIKGGFFEVGSTYRYKNGTWRSQTDQYRIVKLIHLDNPEHSSDSDTAVTIATDENGYQWVENFDKDEFDGMELVTEA